MAVLSPVAKQQFFDNNGNLASGYKLYTYAANTTTPQATYTNAAGTSANANPIVLNSRGEAVIFLDPSLTYDFVLKTAADVTVWTQEDVSSPTGEAGNFAQSGAGAVTRTMQAKARGVAVTPEDFGAVGDGVTDDTVAVQAAVDSGAKVIRGEPGSRYFINGQRVQWSEHDLHRIGAVPYGTAIFDEGYWCGVKVPQGVRIESAHFIITEGADAEKAHHAFAFGDATSLTAPQHNAITGCTFEILESYGGGTPPRCFLAQSLDAFVFEDNRLIGFDDTNNMVGGYLFDCQRFSLSNNEMEYVEVGFVMEFCRGGRVNDNRLYDCWNLCDLDKANARMSVCGNTYDRGAQPGAGSADGVIEVNGCDGLLCIGNVINNARIGIMYAAKSGVANSWNDAINNTGIATYYPSKDVVSKNNISNTSYYAVTAGTHWDSYGHNGVAGASNISLQDTVYNAWIVGAAVGTAEAGAILVNECDGLTVDVSIDTSGGHGLCLRTTKESENTGAGTWSVLKAGRIAGQIRNCQHRGLNAYACNEMVFAGLYVTDCGLASSTMVSTTQCEEKATKMRGSLTIDRGESTATIGWNIGAGGTTAWTASTFDVIMDSVVVKGAFDSTDGLRFTAEETSTANMIPVIFRSAVIDNPDTAYFTENGARSNAGTPISALTPKYIGEPLFDRTNKVWYFGMATSGTSDWQQAGDKPVFTGSAAYDPVSLADGEGATTTVTVTGAATGDFAEASFGPDLQGILLTAWVSAANTVSVRFQNETGGAINLSSGTIRARVRQK